MFVSEHLKLAFPSGDFSGTCPLVELPVADVNSLVRENFSGFDVSAELHLSKDGVSESIGKVGSICFLLLQNEAIAGFRSARFCTGEEELDNCFWLENGVIKVRSTGRGKIFLQLIHEFLFFKLKAARMYAKISSRNELNIGVFSTFKPLEDQFETCAEFEDVTSTFEKSAKPSTRHFFFKSVRWEVPQ